MNNARYTLVQRLLHWAVAVLILLAIILGACIWIYGFEGLKNEFGETATGAIYKYHKTAGLLILGLMVIRVGARMRLGAPSPVASLTVIERTLSMWVQRLLYVALIAMPLVGWLGTGAGGYPVQFFDMTLPGLIGKDPALSRALFEVHGFLAIAILILAGLHIAGALRHWLIKRDEVMRRMSLFG
jgi:cytochrome b561